MANWKQPQCSSEPAFFSLPALIEKRPDSLRESGPIPRPGARRGRSCCAVQPALRECHRRALFMREISRGFSIPGDAHSNRPLVHSCAARCVSPHVLRILYLPGLGPIPRFGARRGRSCCAAQPALRECHWRALFIREISRGFSIPGDAHGDRPLVHSCTARCACHHVLSGGGS